MTKWLTTKTVVISYSGVGISHAACVTNHVQLLLSVPSCRHTFQWGWQDTHLKGSLIYWINFVPRKRIDLAFFSNTDQLQALVPTAIFLHSSVVTNSNNNCLTDYLHLPTALFYHHRSATPSAKDISGTSVIHFIKLFQPHRPFERPVTPRLKAHLGSQQSCFLICNRHFHYN